MASCLQRAAPSAAAAGDVAPMTTNKSARITECRKWIPIHIQPVHRSEQTRTATSTPRGCEIDTQLRLAKVYLRRNRWLLQWVRFGRCVHLPCTAAYPPIAAVPAGCRLRQPWARTGLMQCSNEYRLFDHLVGAHQQGGRNGDSEGLRDLEVDGQLDLGGLLDGQVSRLFSFENPTNVGSG